MDARTRPALLRIPLGNEFRRACRLWSQSSPCCVIRVLAALATSAWPAWLWSVDGSQMLWANAVGAAIFGAATTAACAQRRFDASDASAAQIIRLGRDAAVGRARAARAAARFWRGLRPRAHLRLLAHRPRRRQGRGPDRRGRTGRTGADARRTRAPPVRRSRRADRGFRARRHAASMPMRRRRRGSPARRRCRRSASRRSPRPRSKPAARSGTARIGEARCRGQRRAPRQRRCARAAAHLDRSSRAKLRVAQSAPQEPEQAGRTAPARAAATLPQSRRSKRRRPQPPLPADIRAAGSARRADRRSGGIRCASSGTWMPTAASASGRTNSSNWSGRARWRHSAGRGARSPTS